MRNFEKANMVLFDSTNANFKLAIEAQFTRTNPDQSRRELVYSSEKLTAILNPNIYLTFTYKGGDIPSPVYTSYPQLFRIREALSKVKNMIVDNNGFLMADGVLSVRSDCADPVVVANIGKKNNWISFKLAVIQPTENGDYMPGVSIELSTSERYASVLTAEEFLTVYTIIKDLNLIDLQAILSMSYLETAPINQYGYNPYMAQPQMQQQVMPQQPMQRQEYSAPRIYSQPQQTATYQPRQPQSYGYNNVPRTPSYRTTVQQTAPQPPVAPAPQQPQMTPRSQESNIMNFKNIEETPISEISYDDASEIDKIFDEN